MADYKSKKKKVSDEFEPEEQNNKMNINWLRTIYSNFIETPLFIRVCEG